MKHQNYEVLRRNKADQLLAVIRRLPVETADLDYLIERSLPRLSARGLAALVDALLRWKQSTEE